MFGRVVENGEVPTGAENCATADCGVCPPMNSFLLHVVARMPGLVSVEIEVAPRAFWITTGHGIGAFFSLSWHISVLTPA